MAKLGWRLCYGTSEASLMDQDKRYPSLVLALSWRRGSVPGINPREARSTTHSHMFFFLVSRTRHHSCAGHCFTIRSHCNFFRNATIPPGRNKKQRKTKQTATKQNQQRNTNQTQTENQTPEWKLSSLFLYNIQLK